MGVRVGGLALEYEVESIENIDGLDNVGLGTGHCWEDKRHGRTWVERYEWVGR